VKLVGGGGSLDGGEGGVGYLIDGGGSVRGLDGSGCGVGWFGWWSGVFLDGGGGFGAWFGFW